MRFLLFFLSLGLFSAGQAAMARPWLYVSTFAYGGTGEECLDNAADALREEGLHQQILFCYPLREQLHHVTVYLLRKD